VEVGQGVIWDRFAPVLRGLVEKSNGFRTAMEAFRSKISGRYFVTCANVRYPPIIVPRRESWTIRRSPNTLT
jgi:hypothetical protein